jgi:hypothetical protein
MTDVPTAPALVTIPGVEIVAAGTWKLSSGEATFTTEDLAAAVDAATCPSVGPPVIKLGHVDPRFDGEPAIGRVANMSLTASGNKITGDLTGLPGWLGSPNGSGETVIAAAYPNRSIEGTYGLICQQGHTHPFVITALALLGVAAPGVGVLNSLDDLAALYGVTAAYGDWDTWTLTLAGGPMAGTVLAQGITTEDVRRAYYDAPNVSYAMWITELQLDPLQLIVADEATNQVYRVAVTVKGGTLTFGDPVEVSVEYVDVPAKKQAASREGAVRFASREESREGIAAAWDAGTAQKNLGDDPSPAALKKLYALPGDTKSDSKLPHHDVSSDGTVGAANDDGCSAAIGAINGGRGGIKGVSAAELKAAYNHLAAHLTADGKTPPDYSGPAAEADTEASTDPGEPPEEVSAGHGPCAEATTHSHGHAAFGSQGGDQTHTHEHSHVAGSCDHNHAHATAEAGGKQKGGSKVDYTDEQMASLREILGLGEEFDAAAVIEAASKLKVTAEQKVAAGSRQLPQGVIAVDQERWDVLNKRVQDAEAYQKRQQVKERDQVIAAAIRDGKFSAARRQHWVRLWDADPEGTREVLAGLQKNVIPVSDLGTAAGGEDDLMEEEYRAIFPPGALIRQERQAP